MGGWPILARPPSVARARCNPAVSRRSSLYQIDFQWLWSVAFQSTPADPEIESPSRLCPPSWKLLPRHVSATFVEPAIEVRTYSARNLYLLFSPT